MRIELTVSEIKDLIGPVLQDNPAPCNPLPPCNLPPYLEPPQADYGTRGRAVQDVVYHLSTGNKINAIKRYREYYCVGLLASKVAVDGFAESLDKFFP